MVAIFIVSIPLEQGSVLRLVENAEVTDYMCLNPFGTGQCLTTLNVVLCLVLVHRLNPFGTGQCLTTNNSII